VDTDFAKVWGTKPHDFPGSPLDPLAAASCRSPRKNGATILSLILAGVTLKGGGVTEKTHKKPASKPADSE
jgi:hypothetical protein